MEHLLKIKAVLHIINPPLTHAYKKFIFSVKFICHKLPVFLIFLIDRLLERPNQHSTKKDYKNRNELNEIPVLYFL